MVKLLVVMEIGKALWEIRENELNKAQNVAAHEIGITQSYLSQIEDGKKIPSQEVLEKICKTYGVPVSVVVWMATYPDDVAKDKRSAFKVLKPLVDDLINDYFANTIRKK